MAHLEAHPQHCQFRSVVIRVGLQPGEGTTDDRPCACIPDYLPRRGWSIHVKGYLYYTSRAISTNIRRGQLAHREVIERLLGRKLKSDEHVHHQDFNKLNDCPCNLTIVPAELNPSFVKLDPYTGKFLSRNQYYKRYPDTVPDPEVPF